MSYRLAKLAVLLGAVVALCGCRGCMRENVVWEHTFNRPDYRMCPPVAAEYEPPPGGPYYSTPGACPVKGAAHKTMGSEITVK